MRWIAHRSGGAFRSWPIRAALTPNIPAISFSVFPSSLSFFIDAISASMSLTLPEVGAV